MFFSYLFCAIRTESLKKWVIFCIIKQNVIGRRLMRMFNRLVSGVLLGALTVSLFTPGTTAEAAKKTSLKQTKITVLTGKTEKL